MNGGLIFGAILKMNGTSGVTQRQMRYLQHAARAAKLSNCRIRVDDGFAVENLMKVS